MYVIILYLFIDFFANVCLNQVFEELCLQYMSFLVLVYWYIMFSLWVSQICFFLGIQNWNSDGWVFELGRDGKLYWGGLFWVLYINKLVENVSLQRKVKE